MQILASALPGFRDLRAPLTAGYLWLILVWIWLHPDLAVRPTNAIAGSLFDLGTRVGPIWLGLGVSVGAYLIGAVSQSLTSPLSQTARLLHQFVTLPGKMKGFLDHRDRQVFAVVRPYEELALSKIIEPPNSAGPQARKYWQEQHDKARERAAVARRSLARELSLPATLLLGKEPTLFNEADRLKAESQLRFSVVPPLVAMTGFLITHQTWLYIIAFIPIGVLWWQGYAKELEFRTLMLNAFQEDARTSRTITELKYWVDNLPTMQFGGRFPPGRPNSRTIAVERVTDDED